MKDEELIGSMERAVGYLIRSMPDLVRKGHSVHPPLLEASDFRRYSGRKIILTPNCKLAFESLPTDNIWDVLGYVRNLAEE